MKHNTICNLDCFAAKILWTLRENRMYLACAAFCAGVFSFLPEVVDCGDSAVSDVDGVGGSLGVDV